MGYRHPRLFPPSTCLCRVSSSGSSSVRPARASEVLIWHWPQKRQSFTCFYCSKSKKKRKQSKTGAAHSFQEELTGCAVARLSKLSLCKDPVIPWEEQTGPERNLAPNYKEPTRLCACSSSSTERAAPSTACEAQGLLVPSEQPGGKGSFYSACR